MLKDCRDLTLSTDAAEVVAAYDHAIEGFLGYRADLMQRIEALLASDRDFGMAHVIKGYMMMASYRADLLPAARAASAAAWRSVANGTSREHAHAEALDQWVSGDVDRAIAVWNHILREHPRDILAFRLAHFVNFWSGRPEAMLASVLEVAPAWSPALPGYVSILGCRCFAHEEAGY